MIPPGESLDWQRRIITLYHLGEDNCLTKTMGLSWFHPGIPAGGVTLMPIRLLRHENVYSMFYAGNFIADKPLLLEFDRYHPTPCSMRHSNRPNTVEYAEKYSQLLVVAGLVPPGKQEPASPPSLPWTKAFKSEREKFWKQLPQSPVIAEIGVDKAGTAIDIIIPTANPKKLYLVDPWDLVDAKEQIWEQAKENREEIQNYFKDNEKVEIVHGFSDQAAQNFDSQYFDVVFSDWALSFQDTKKDIVNWLPKVKKGGFICGDLFCLEDHHWSGAFGAILEFLAKYVLKDESILERLEQTRTELISALHYKYIVTGKDFSNVEFYMKEHTGGDLMVRYLSKTLNFGSFARVEEKCEDVIQTKPDLQSLITMGNSPYFKYYPSGRTRAGTWAIKVGDWAENIDYNELQEWADSNNDTKWIPVVFEKK